MISSAFRTVEISDPAFEHEGLRSVTVKSRALGRRANVSVWVPQAEEPAEEISTLLILLHGVYGSHWVWSQKGGVHRTAQQLLAAGEIGPMVIAMPSDGLGRDGSGYLTWPQKENIEQWIVDEVPAVARLAAPALKPDAKIALGGISMGGYGALRLGAKFADRFSAISAHSAITGIAELESFVEEPLGDYLQCAPRGELDALYWMRRHRDRLPKLRFDCGVDDALISANRALHSALSDENIAHEYAEYPGGHAWPYWQEHVAETLRFTSENH